MTGFALPAPLVELRGRVRAFVDDRVIPVEDDVVREDRERRYETLHRLQQEAKQAGLWTPHLPKELGGLGLGVLGMCALFRDMGRSLCGARVFHCDAPDQGNMDLLVSVASKEQRARWLEPLVAGSITSAFCMTEPAPGAGTDPSNLRTKATRDGDGWVIEGHKWYSTGGGDAAFLIVMARTSDDPRRGATMFVVDRGADGVEHVRDVSTMGGGLLAHREAELRFHGVRVGADAVLGGEGEGFRLAQKRLVPARLTHCMRWLGLADRAMSLCRAYVSTRESFGQVLARHQLVQRFFAENAAAVHAGNLMTLHCAEMLEAGDAKAARAYSSMAKTHVARTLCKVLDDAIQMHGALGYSDDVPFASWYRHARAARIADGPDEIHEVFVAREFLLGKLELLV
ncbi:MAG TPA: acyl-CoA dehydrogenase family protein [Minicystis sp.]|nr:acyl-CoA dehydrogenase family protein [Minicystis sp.]